MSIYYKQNFTNANSLYAEVKEEMNSYFASGIIDDVMFPKWTEHCLKRFRKSAFRIEETIIDINDFKAELPCDFNAVREAWACVWDYPIIYQDPSSYYYQTDCRIDIPGQFDKCDECFETETCTTDYMVTHKVTGTNLFRFRHSYLLKPANNHVKDRHCGDCCPNLFSEAPDTFNIEDGYMITSFCTGKIHLIYYANTTNDQLEQMVPDNFWVQDYIRKYLIYMCYRKICNSITDETYNQVEKKKLKAEQEQAEAYVVADIELKKQTAAEKVRQVGVLNRRNDSFRLTGDRGYNTYRKWPTDSNNP